MRKEQQISLASRRQGTARHGVSRLVSLGLALGVTATLLLGCSSNEGDLPGGFVPDGIFGPETFLVIQVALIGNPGGSTDSAVVISIVDRTLADGFRLYRKLDGEESFNRPSVSPAEFVGTFNTGYRIFQAIDRDWQRGRLAQYLVRATVQGEESRSSPISNIATVPNRSFADLLSSSFDMVAPIDTAEVDSVPLMAWESVPGAVQYVVNILRTDGRLFFVGFTPPDGSTTYQLGSHLGVPVQDSLLTPSAYFWSVSAIDADSRIIANTPQPPQIFLVKSLIPDR